jgi:hypothetical protein
VPADVFAAIATNDLVSMRAAELEAATLQEQGRLAVQRGDWDQAQYFLRELRTFAQGNPWLLASVEQLQRYADRREAEHFSKEAKYTAEKLRSRLAAQNEEVAWSEGIDDNKASFLRRKREQGRRFNTPKKDPDLLSGL